MGTGYTRTNTSDIQADEVVKSAPLNAELNAVVNAFAALIDWFVIQANIKRRKARYAQ